MSAVSFTCILILLICSIGLPATGIARALYEVGEPVARRARYKKRRTLFEHELSAAATEADRLKVQHEYEKDINRPDKKQRTLGEFGVETIRSDSVISQERLAALRRDAAFVLAGLACGAAAGIWALIESA